MSYCDEKDIGPSREELIAAKGPFGLAVILIAVAFMAIVLLVAWLIGAKDLS
jgi:uncharacterized membrane protein YqjE